jgi:hypothetical protein
MVRIGQILLVGLVVAAGIAGWVGVEKYVIADDTNSLPSLGAGLPTTRVDPPEVPWRRFVTTRVGPTIDQTLWLDIDALEIKGDESNRDPAASPGTPPATNQFEFRDDIGYVKRDGGDWTAVEPDNAGGATETFLSRYRPRLLTDVVPPAAVPFVVLTDEQEADGVRTYSMTVDAAAFRAALPVDFERWMFYERNDEHLPRSLKVGVRADGYVVVLENTSAIGVTTASWQELTGPILMESPIGPTPVTSVPTLPTTSVPG